MWHGDKWKKALKIIRKSDDYKKWKDENKYWVTWGSTGRSDESGKQKSEYSIYRNIFIQVEPTESQGQVSDTLTIISPLERLLKTKPIWFLPDVTREESSHFLHNKKPGVSSRFMSHCSKVFFLQNFIIRGSRQPDTLAISVRIGTNESNRVQHFIILMTERNVCLEDSDIKFANLVSLVFHYSHTW